MVSNTSLLKHLYHRWLCPVFDPVKALRAMHHYLTYWTQWRRYAQLPGAEKLRFVNGYPSLGDHTSSTAFDPHYLYQAVWAMECIVQGIAKRHIDIGSDIKFVTMLTTHLPVTFVDIRPLHVKGIGHLTNLAGDLLTLPFANSSIMSLSCLHVAEHVGLGRYGDTLNPLGTHQACAELARVLAPGGNLFFSLPVGQPRVCFNAHRIHSPLQVLGYFNSLELIEFSATDDDGKFHSNIKPENMEQVKYGCGLFWFRKGK
jgi:SAM-dependent methyltransferase